VSFSRICLYLEVCIDHSIGALLEGLISFGLYNFDIDYWLRI
jgi:hypothetical protein